MPKSFPNTWITMPLLTFVTPINRGFRQERCGPVRGLIRGKEGNELPAGLQRR